MQNHRSWRRGILVTCTTFRALVLLACSLLAAPPAEPQPPKKVPRIGVLLLDPAEYPVPRAMLDAFRQGLRDLGYVEGQNVALEFRSAEGKLDRLPRLAAELVGLQVDVIVTFGGTPSAFAAKQATPTIPIVVAGMADPVGDRLAASLARPGGNITGNTFLGPELVPKRLELLKETVPAASRVAVLWHPGVYGERTMTDMVKEIKGAARTLGVQLQFVEARGPDDFDRAFAAMRRGRADALVVFPSPMFYHQHRRIVELVARNRLPAIFAFREAVEAGGLMAYGASIPDLFRGAATQVDKILKGRKPADLPVEQPMRFEFVINMKTAKALGITFPQTILIRADQVIQ